MKRNLLVLLSVLFVLSFSTMQVFAAKKNAKKPVAEKQDKEEIVKMSDRKTLVVYYSATGTTKKGSWENSKSGKCRYLWNNSSKSFSLEREIKASEKDISRFNDKINERIKNGILLLYLLNIRLEQLWL